jgi:uncharacterized membrane protein YfcA
MLSAFLGGRIGAHLPGEVLLFAFSVIMLFTGIAMIRRSKRPEVLRVGQIKTYRLILDGAVVGFVTGIVGAGGGFMVVPALVLFGGLAIREAIATSLLVVVMKSVGAFVGYALKFGDGALISLNEKISFDFRIVILSILGASIGSIIGSLFSAKVKPERLTVAFGWFVILIASLVFIENLIDVIIT